MSESFEPRVYAKGDQRKTAASISQAVALEFEGFKVVESEDAEKSGAPAPSVSDTSEVRDVDSNAPADENVSPTPSRVFGSLSKS